MRVRRGVRGVQRVADRVGARAIARSAAAPDGPCTRRPRRRSSRRKYPSKGEKPSGYSCPDGQWCIAYEAPNHDITSFDNILGAWLAIFQCISLEGWVDIMYWTQDAVSEWSSWYFVVMIIIGSFFAINLALAVLYVSFTTERKTNEQHSDAIAAEKEANSKQVDGERGRVPGGAGGGVAGDVAGAEERAAVTVRVPARILRRATPPAAGINGSRTSWEVEMGAGYHDAETPDDDDDDDDDVARRPSSLTASARRSWKRDSDAASMGGGRRRRRFRGPAVAGGFRHAAGVGETPRRRDRRRADRRRRAGGGAAVLGAAVSSRTCRVLAMSATVGKVTMFLIILNTVLMARVSRDEQGSDWHF